MKFREFILNFTARVRKDIVELAKTELSNENKKLALDHNIVEYVEKAINGMTINFVLKFALKRLLLPNVSLITQVIFDLLKARIEGITK